MRLSLKENVTVETESGARKYLHPGEVIEFNPKEVIEAYTSGESICPVMGQYDEVWFIDTTYMYNLLPKHLLPA